MSTDEPYSDDIEEVLYAVHGLPKSRLEEVADVTTLRDVATGERSAASQGARTRALTALGRLREPGVSTEVLRTVAKNRREDHLVRTAAVASFRYLSEETAERASLDLLDTEEPSIRATAVANVAFVGGDDALEALETLDATVDTDTGRLGRPATFENQLTRRVAFAEAVIAYRLRKEDCPSFRVDGLDRFDLRDGEGEPITSHRIEDTETVLRNTREPLYGLSLATDAGLELTVQSDETTRMSVLLNEAIADDPVSELTTRSAIFALILYYSAEMDGYEPGIIGFCAPTDDGVTATLCRSDGKAVYAGTGAVDDDVIDLSLTDTGLVGSAPTWLHLRLSADGLSLEDGRTLPDRRVTRSPEPLNS